MRKNILVNIFLIVSLNSQSQTPKSTNNDGIIISQFDKSFQDILITYDLLSGQENWYLKKVGAQEFSDYNYKKGFNKFGTKVRCHQHIYLKLVNYNPNRYEIKTQFNNKEIEIAGKGRESFESTFNSLISSMPSNVSALDSLQTNSVLEANDKIQNDLNWLIKSSGFMIDENDKITGVTNIDFTLNKLKSGNINIDQLTQTLAINLTDTVEKSDSLLKLILEATYANQEELKKLSDSVEKSIENFNIERKHLIDDLEKLNQRLNETALRPDIQSMKDDAVSYMNEYSGKPGSEIYPIRADFLAIPGAILKDLKISVEIISRNTEKYDSIAGTITNINSALQTIKGVTEKYPDREITKEVKSISEQFNRTTQLIAETNKKLREINQSAKNKLEEIQKTDWKVQFSNTFELFNKIIRLTDNTLTIELGQAESDISHLEIEFSEISLTDDKIQKVNLPERKIIHDFRVFRGARLSFSPGFAFSFYGNDQRNYVKRQLPSDINPTQDSSMIVPERGNSFTPLFTNMVHIQWRSSNDIAPGLTLGLGVPLSGSKDIQYLFGGSLLLGTKERFIISAGASGGKITKLGGGYEPNQKIPSSMDIPLAKDQYKIGMFLSVSVNLISAK
jgi:hypothetical protein